MKAPLQLSFFTFVRATIIIFVQIFCFSILFVQASLSPIQVSFLPHSHGGRLSRNDSEYQCHQFSKRNTKIYFVPPHLQKYHIRLLDNSKIHGYLNMAPSSNSNSNSNGTSSHQQHSGNGNDARHNINTQNKNLDSKAVDDHQHDVSIDNVENGMEVTLEKPLHEMTEEERAKPLRAMLAALSFENYLPHLHLPRPHMPAVVEQAGDRLLRRRRRRHRKGKDVDQGSKKGYSNDEEAVDVNRILRGTLDPDGEVEDVFFDAAQFGDGETENEFKARYDRESVVVPSILADHATIEAYLELSHSHSSRDCSAPAIKALADSPVKSSEQDDDEEEDLTDGSFTQEEDDVDDSFMDKPFPRSPPPPQELPLRFLRAGKGDPVEGLRRYQATLQWRKQHGIDQILREHHPHFDLIKQHYPHFYCGRGRNGEPCFFEQPPKTNLKALRQGNVTLDMLLRHYAMVTEFGWQFLDRDDLARSVYIIDLEGIRFGDFVGEAVDFVKKASAFTSQNYPERAGCVMVIHVPAWFKVIWNVVKPMVDEVTLQKIFILRGKEEIQQALEQKIAPENIPMEYGGKGPRMAESEEEILLADLMRHNALMATNNGVCPCGGRRAKPPCRFCSWVPARSY
jgi:hypothetical protein